MQDVFNGTSSTHASFINYWPNRAIQSATLGHPNLNGSSIVDNTTLNSRLQVSNRSAQVGSVFPVQLNFTYGASGMNSGNVTAQQIQTIAAPNPPCLGALPCSPVSIPALNLSQAYAYDAYDRLSSATETGGASDWTQTYLYDQSGNRAVQTGSYIPNSNGTPTALGQFTNNKWMGTGAAYDASGNATSVPGSTAETFTYDAENRVSKVQASGTITYVYDGEGRRVQKTTSPSTFTSNYIYDSGPTVNHSCYPYGETEKNRHMLATSWSVDQVSGPERQVRDQDAAVYGGFCAAFERPRS